MSRLKYYRMEREKLEPYFSEDVSEQLTEIIYKKLNQRYKLKLGDLVWYGKNGGGTFYYKGYISLGRNTNIGTIAHEFAHALEYRQYKKRKRKLHLEGKRVKRYTSHGKKHFRIMRRVAIVIDLNMMKWSEELNTK